MAAITYEGIRPGVVLRSTVLEGVSNSATTTASQSIHSQETLYSSHTTERIMMKQLKQLLEGKTGTERQEITSIFAHLVDTVGGNEAQHILDIITGLLNFEKQIAEIAATSGELPVTSEGHPLNVHAKNVTELAQYVERRNGGLQKPIDVTKVERLYEVMETRLVNVQ